MCVCVSVAVRPEPYCKDKRAKNKYRNSCREKKKRAGEKKTPTQLLCFIIVTKKEG